MSARSNQEPPTIIGDCKTVDALNNNNSIEAPNIKQAICTTANSQITPANSVASELLSVEEVAKFG